MGEENCVIKNTAKLGQANADHQNLSLFLFLTSDEGASKDTAPGIHISILLTEPLTHLMAYRTDPSSSSLTRYAAARSPEMDIYNGSSSRDFCNAFWGQGDGGVDVLFARLRGAARTMEELKAFWKERLAGFSEYR